MKMQYRSDLLNRPRQSQKLYPEKKRNETAFRNRPCLLLYLKQKSSKERSPWPRNLPSSKLHHRGFHHLHKRKPWNRPSLTPLYRRILCPNIRPLRPQAAAARLVLATFLARERWVSFPDLERAEAAARRLLVWDEVPGHRVRPHQQLRFAQVAKPSPCKLSGQPIHRWLCAWDSKATLP